WAFARFIDKKRSEFDGNVVGSKRRDECLLHLVVCRQFQRTRLMIRDSEKAGSRTRSQSANFDPRFDLMKPARESLIRRPITNQVIALLIVHYLLQTEVIRVANQETTSFFRQQVCA